MKSRRKDYRYGIFQHAVTFRTAYEDGTGFLTNISTGGCAIDRVSPVLTIHEPFLLVIDTGEQYEPIEARGVVTRVNGNLIGARFTLISPDSKNKIRNFFAAKLRQH